MSDLRAAAQQALEALEHDGLLKKRQAITASAPRYLAHTNARHGRNVRAPR